MPPKGKAVTAQIARLGSFICVCGDLVLDRDRSKHQCLGGTKVKATPKATVDSVDDVSDFKTVPTTKGAPLIDRSQIKVLRTLNWTLAFGRRGQLVIVLKRKDPKNPTVPLLVVSDVVDDGLLPIHTYRFESEGSHYSFEFFM